MNRRDFIGAAFGVLGLALAKVVGVESVCNRKTKLKQESLQALDHAFRPYKGVIQEAYALHRNADDSLESRTVEEKTPERLYQLCFEDAPDIHRLELPSCDSEGMWVITQIYLGQEKEHFEFPGTYTILPDIFTYTPLIKHQGKMIRAYRLSHI